MVPFDGVSDNERIAVASLGDSDGVFEHGVFDSSRLGERSLFVMERVRVPIVKVIDDVQLLVVEGPATDPEADDVRGSLRPLRVREKCVFVDDRSKDPEGDSERRSADRLADSEGPLSDKDCV